MDLGGLEAKIKALLERCESLKREKAVLAAQCEKLQTKNQQALDKAKQLLQQLQAMKEGES